MKKTLFGILLFLLQISLAIFYNATIDLLVIGMVAAIIFAYVLYNYRNKKYESCEIG